MGSPARRPALALILLTAALLLLAGCAGGARKPAASGPAFFPALPDVPRLQFVMSISGDADLPGARRGLSGVLLGEKSVSQFVRPRGVAVHNGVIFVSDSGLHTVVKVDLAAGTFESIQDQGSGKLAGPAGLDIAEDGTLYVADLSRQQVLVFEPEAQKFVQVIGDPEKIRPTDVSVRGDRLFVSDVMNHRVVVYDRHSGAQLASIGEEGEAPGNFKFPSFLSVGADGYLYVSDGMNFRIQKLTLDGEWVKSFGKAGDWTGNLARPKGVDADADGRLHVLDAAFENAQIFLPDGTPATAYGGYGNFEGHMYLPYEVCLDTSLVPLLKSRVDPRLEPLYAVLVTNQAGPHRLNIYVFGKPVGFTGTNPLQQEKLPTADDAPASGGGASGGGAPGLD